MCCREVQFERTVLQKLVVLEGGTLLVRYVTLWTPSEDQVSQVRTVIDVASRTCSPKSSTTSQKLLVFIDRLKIRDQL